MAESQIANLKLDFIGSLLRKYENDKSIKVTELNAKPACEKGDNFMSIVSKVFVKGKKIVDDDETDFTTSLIVKHPFQSEIMNDLFQSNNIFANEVFAYNKVIPALRTHFNIKLSLAECLYAGTDCIVLKDLTLDNYQMKTEPCFSISDCVTVLKELAKLHASSVILKHNDPELVLNLSLQIYEFFVQENNFFSSTTNQTIETIIDVFKKAESSPKNRQIVDYFEAHKDDVYKTVSNLLQKKYDTAVFNHGDCWRNNLLLRNIGSETEVVLVDLQIMRYMSIAADLSYFLFINLTSKTRRENFDYFLDQYFETFKQYVTEHGVDFDQLPFTIEKLRTEMYEFQIFGFLMSSIISPMFYLDKSLLPNMEDLTPEQLDPEVQKDYYLNNMNPALSDRIMDIALDFAENYKFL